MAAEQFELVLEGAKDNSVKTQEQILEVLNGKAGFRIFEVDKLLASGSVSLFSAPSANDLAGLCDALSKAGGKVQIVRSTRSPQSSLQTEPSLTEQSFKGFYQKYVTRFSRILESMDLAVVEELVEDLIAARAEDRQIFVVGNGGSAASASHMATDFAKNRFPGDDSKNFRIMSLSDNTAWITATANDYGYENIFVNQLKNLMRKGDVVIAISSSGNSKNVVRALELANERGGVTYAMVGFTGGALKEVAQKTIYIPTKSGQYGFHEDMCMVINHVMSIYIHEQDKMGAE